MINLTNLCLKFTKEYYALYNINLTIDDGERVCLFGQAESGKTSILRTLAGLEKEYTGDAYINNKDVKTIDYKYDINLAYLPKQGVFFDNKSVAYNIEYAIRLRDKTSSPYDIEQKIDDLLTNFEMLNLKNSKVKELTIYEKYLLSLARTTIREIDVLLVDNIFDYLEDEQKNTLISLIKKLYYNDRTICIFSTEEESNLELFDARIVNINNGVIIGDK